MQYEKIYHAQISLGKSELFAHHFADMIAEGNSIVFAHYYATAYIEATEKGKSEQYVGLYSEMLGEKMANQYSSVEEAQKDKDFRFYIDNTLGYMKGWEYAKAHKLGNIKQFIALYQDEYINTYHAEIGSPTLPDEELDAIVLKKILQKIGIINKRNE